MEANVQVDDQSTSVEDQGIKHYKPGLLEYAEYIKNQIESIDDTNDARAAASIYIVDNRSIGNYFEHNATVSGNVHAQFALPYNANTALTGFAPISLRLAEKIKSVYVERASDAKSLEILGRYNLLIIQGDPDHGKRTTALNLLLAKYDTNSIYELPSNIDNFSGLNLNSGSAYLVDASFSSSQKSDSLTFDSLNKVSTNLLKRNTSLIIIVDNSLRLEREVENTYIIHICELPDQRRLLASHVQWYSKLASNNCDYSDILNTDEIGRILADKLMPSKIDQLAEVLSRVGKDGLSLEQALSSFSQGLKDEINDWFRRNTEIESRLSLIVISVVNGCKLHYFDAIIRRFRQILSGDPKSTVECDLDSLFSSSRSTLLKTIYCSLDQEYEKTPHGLIPIETIKLDNSGFQSAILSHVWQEYQQIKEPLLLLLNELGQHKSSNVRLKVATAVGELCKYDFNLVLDNIVYKWANAKDLKLQALAALALYIPLCDSISTMTVISLLQNWSQPHSSDSLRITSIFAYRNYVSIYFQNLAITNLFEILVTSSGSTFYAAAEAICDFFKSGATESERYLLVLNTMCTIFKGETRNPSLAAICCLFAILLQNCHTYSLDTNRKVSTLLWLLQQEQALVRSSVDQAALIKYQPCIVMLIRIAINHDKKLRKVILNELSDWLQIADEYRQFFSPTGNLIYKVYIGESIHGQARIHAFLNSCSLRDNSPSAREILLKLS